MPESPQTHSTVVRGDHWPWDANDEHLDVDVVDNDHDVETIRRNPLPPELSSRIPLEVVECIIDYMGHPTLFAAALVCRAWHHRALRNLYSSVEIATRGNYESLLEQFRTSPRVKQRLARAHKLVIGSYRSKEEDSHFLATLPLTLAHALPALRILSINGLLRPAMHLTFYRALHHLKHIVSLSLSLVTLSNTIELQRVVCAFPHLEHLALEDVTFRRPHSAGDQARSSALALSRRNADIKLKSLSFIIMSYEVQEDPMDLETIIDWLLRSAVCASLQELTLDLMHFSPDMIDDRERDENINRLLEESGSALVSFHVHEQHCYKHVYHHTATGLNFVHNTSLRHLTLSLFVIADKLEEGWPATAAELQATFAMLRSDQLECIILEFSIFVSAWGEPDILRLEELTTSEEKLASSQSSALHTIMVQSCFDALEEVDIRINVVVDVSIQSKEWADGIARSVVLVFPQLFAPWHDRGVIRISHVLSMPPSDLWPWQDTAIPDLPDTSTL
ncbi:hypothetical protein EVJ58_g252 [Rhodofomes roseus]|uniref:F-box domain-containing protein n=1 Tax=Rhodofomes roseus TaxID=34475 RepID=A0A4Y9Z5H2_9APHY|nr:hypothetical protein EVJ58_g252 [Rhodofomes roseus]